MPSSSTPRPTTTRWSASTAVTASGASFHEEPQVLHYGTPGTGLIIEPGMTFTIEPMLNAGKRHVKLLADQWTVVTKDRSLSAQWEHTLLATDDGFEVLTKRAEDDI